MATVATGHQGYLGTVRPGRFMGAGPRDGEQVSSIVSNFDGQTPASLDWWATSAPMSFPARWWRIFHAALGPCRPPADGGNTQPLEGAGYAGPQFPFPGLYVCRQS